MSAGGIHRALHPTDFAQIDPVFMLQQAIDVDRRAHGQERHADTLVFEVLGLLDAGCAVNGNEAVAEGSRGKDRNSNERTLPIREALDELRARKFGHVEFFAACHTIENGAWLIDGDEIQIDALDLHLAGVERLHAVVEPAGKRKLHIGHGFPRSAGARSWCSMGLAWAGTPRASSPASSHASAGSSGSCAPSSPKVIQ